jgi:PAS domain S-box-containing protein
MDDDQLIDQTLDFTAFDLPIGVYVVTPRGRFVKANPQVFKILGLREDELIGSSILDIYPDPALRERLLSEVLESEARGVGARSVILSLDIKGRHIFVQDHTRSIRDEANTVLGFVCCMVDVTAQERYRRLFESLPIGVYQLDASDVVINANVALAKMLGYESTSEVIGRTVDHFYVEPEEAARFRARLLQKESITDGHVVELRTRTKGTIYASISAHVLRNQDGTYGGREGTLTNVTIEERYRKILENVPLGLYTARMDDNSLVVSDCNPQYARMHEFDRRDDALNFEMSRFYATPEDERRFVRALRQADDEGRPLAGFAVNVITRKGRARVFEVHGTLLRDANKNIVGRAGTIRDITDDVQRQQQIRELTDDIGQLLHTYTAMLVMLDHSLRPVVGSLEPNPFQRDDRPSLEERLSALRRASHTVTTAARHFLTTTASQAGTMKPGHREQIALQVQNLETLESTVSRLELRRASYRACSEGILQAARHIRPSPTTRDGLRSVLSATDSLLRACNVLAVYDALDAIGEMEVQVRALREYVMSGVRPQEPRSLHHVTTLIQRAVASLDDFAQSRDVEFRIKTDARYMVHVIERDIVRALNNLLHNAAKYSWNRHDGPPWIGVRARVHKGAVFIDVESWGVPIPKEEIDTELVFRIGYRGRLSGDRGRVGTGIGLADSRRVARLHGGDVTIQSAPARGGPSDDDTQPYVTIATLSLPLHDSGAVDR